MRHTSTSLGSGFHDLRCTAELTKRAELRFKNRQSGSHKSFQKLFLEKVFEIQISCEEASRRCKCSHGNRIEDVFSIVLIVLKGKDWSLLAVVQTE